MKSILLAIQVFATVLGLPCYGHGDVHEVIERLTERIKASPEEATLYLERSSYYLKHKEYKQALQDLATVEKLDSSLSGRLVILAQIQSRQGSHQDALDTLSSHIAKYPNEYLPYKLRGMIHVQLGQPELAEKDMATSIRVHPQPPLHLFLAQQQLLEKNGKVDLAIKVYDDAERALGPLPALLEAKATKLTAAGNRDQAAATYSRLRRLQPKLDFQWWAKEAAMWSPHDQEKTIHATRKALQAWPKLPARTRNLPHFLKLHDQLRKSIAALSDRDPIKPLPHLQHQPR